MPTPKIFRRTEICCELIMVNIMQKGFATLEIILVMLIIGLLTSAAIPNINRAIDRASLDYETKNLYGDLRLMLSANRSGRFPLNGLGRSFTFEDNLVMHIDKSNKAYEILRGKSSVKIHRMQNIRSLETNLNWTENNSWLVEIKSDSLGKMTNYIWKSLSGNITLTSRYGKPTKIVFDSVGRIRGGRSDE